jgi:hypothetical protein
MQAAEAVELKELEGSELEVPVVVAEGIQIAMLFRQFLVLPTLAAEVADARQFLARVQQEAVDQVLLSLDM